MAQGFGAGSAGPLHARRRRRATTATARVAALSRDAARDEPGVAGRRAAARQPRRRHRGADRDARRRSPQSQATEDLIHTLRDDVRAAAAGCDVDVGGPTASLVDQSEVDRAAAAAVHRRRRRAVVPAPARRRSARRCVALKAGRDEPAVDRRGLRRRRARGRRRLRRRADRDRHRDAGAAVHPGDDVRDPVRALDGLRGVPALARARGVPARRRHRAARCATGWPRPRA